MDVSVWRKVSIGCTTMIAAGCMNPGYQTLHPPGFSRTALKVQEHQRELTQAEMEQLMGTQLEGMPQEARKSKETEQAKRSRDSGAYWAPGYAALAKSQEAAEAAHEREEERLAAEPQRPSFSGWAERGQETLRR